MRKKRFNVEQMIGVLKQAEVGVPVAEVICKAGSASRRSTDGRTKGGVAKIGAKGGRATRFEIA